MKSFSYNWAKDLAAFLVQRETPLARKEGVLFPFCVLFFFCALDSLKSF